MKKGPFIVIQTLFILVLLIGGPVLSMPTASAQQVNLQLSQEERARLEAELKQLEADLAQKQKELATQKNYSGTLQGDIKVLTAKINAKKAEVRAKNARIAQLTSSIGEKQTTIASLVEKIEKQKQSLGQLLRKTNEMDKATLANFILSTESLSEFYADVSHYDKLKEEIKRSVDEINQIKGVNEATKAQLEKEQAKTLDERNQLANVQASIQKDQQEQQRLLSISKNKEAEYQKVIAEQQKKVSEIQARLFQLAGGSSAIRFDEALRYAEAASAVTGVEAALILAIATQESNLGANVGQCYLYNAETGSTQGKNTGRIFENGMKPSRDVKPFLEITAALGYNAYKTAVSCPIAGVAGYGGAMGPSQFIPSTWKLFEGRLSKALGVQTPNPWVAAHAFMASAMYLADLGGTGSSYSAQKAAACRYYGGGSSCRSVTSPYGNSVMSLKAKIQEDIDYIKEYGVAR